MVQECGYGGDAVNPKRLAKLFRERAALDLEIAEALLEEEPKRPRRRSKSEPKVQPSEKAVDDVRRKLRRGGVAA